MKMSMGKRLILLLHWLLSLLLFVVAAFYCIWPEMAAKGIEFINASVGASAAEIAGIVLLALYAVFAVLGIIVLVSKKQKDDESGFITVISDATGKTRIAVGAIDQMIRIAVRSIDGIADLRTVITNEMDSIAIAVNVSVLTGVHIPTVTANIQRTISNYIELNCGVTVREVSVSVSALETPEDANKRGRKKFGKFLGTAPAAIEEVPAKSVEEVQATEPVIIPEVAEITPSEGE